MTAKNAPGAAPKIRPLTDEERAVIDRIKERVKARGLTMAGLARAIGATSNAGNQWGSYRALPRQRTLHRIAEVLEVTQNWLLTGEVDPVDRPVTTIEVELLAVARELPLELQRLLVATAKGWAPPKTTKN